jgi:hypothetical protein
MPEVVIPPLVRTIWWAGLILTLVVFIPLAVYLLHQLWRTAQSIQRYAREALTAAVGIAGHTGQIGALDQTIHVAGEVLSTAGAIERHLGAAANQLARRGRA